MKFGMGIFTLTLGGAAAMVLDQVTSKNPFTAWASLQAKCAAVSTNAYIDVTQQVKSYVMENPYKEQDSWIVRLVSLNARLESIAVTYRRDEFQLISHIMHRLLQETYKNLVSFYNIQGYLTMTLDVF